MGQHQHHGSIASANNSVQASTPGLIPPSSAQSCTSGHSLISHHAQTSLQGHTSGTMYPTLLMDGKQKKVSAQQMVIDPALGGETSKTSTSRETVCGLKICD